MEYYIIAISLCLFLSIPDFQKLYKRNSENKYIKTFMIYKSELNDIINDMVLLTKDCNNNIIILSKQFNEIVNNTNDIANNIDKLKYIQYKLNHINTILKIIKLWKYNTIIMIKLNEYILQNINILYVDEINNYIMKFNIYIKMSKNIRNYEMKLYYINLLKQSKISKICKKNR